MGGGVPFFFPFAFALLRSDDERLWGLGKSLWSSIEVGAQQQTNKQTNPYYNPFVTSTTIIIVVVTCNNKN